MSSDDPIQITTSTASEGTKDSIICHLCRRQFAKYTCPTCNVPYCSLTCFRSQAHNQCSEGFYKKEIEADIHAGPSKSAQERQQMMDMLRAFEEETASEQKLDEAETDEDGEGDHVLDLAKRFETVDLDTLAPDALWSMLTKEERSRFMNAFDDPNSALALQLLSSEQLEKDSQDPWWEASELIEDDNEPSTFGRRTGPRPEIMDIPVTMIRAVPTGHPLVYNMCAICIAYAYISRHLATSPLERLKPEDPECQEARRLVSKLVPFLTDRKSTQLYPNIPSVIKDIWSFMDVGKMTSSLFALLLRDASHLLKPLRITPMVSSAEAPSGFTVDSHPHCMPILVLSDLHGLFTNGGRRKESHGERKGNHVAHKLRFYAIHILSTPSVVLESIGSELEARARGYELDRL